MSSDNVFNMGNFVVVPNNDCSFFWWSTILGW